MAAWLTKMLSWLKQPGGSHRATLSPYQETSLLFRGSTVPDLLVYRDFSALEVIQPTLEQYLGQVSWAIQCLEQDTLFRRAEDEPIYPRLVARADFYLTKQGAYSDVAQDHRILVTEVCTLLELYERRLSEHRPSPVVQTNLQRISPLISNLFSLGRQLNED